MKKFLIVKITQKVDDNNHQTIDIIATEITCFPSDEAHIKRSIESTKNPDILTAIITKDMGHSDFMEIKKHLDVLRERIRSADTIETAFISEEGCDNDCDTCILKDLYRQIEKQLLNEKLRLLSPCMN